MVWVLDVALCNGKHHQLTSKACFEVRQILTVPGCIADVLLAAGFGLLNSLFEFGSGAGHLLDNLHSSVS